MKEVSTAHLQLSAGEIISNGITVGMKNFLNLFLTAILFVVTIWIPYLNIGSFVGMQDLVPRMSRGESISPTGIFDARYRKNFGEFFLLLALLYAGLLAGTIFLAVGALIVSLAWMLAMPLFVDKGTGPIESLRLSNQLTYGHKMTIFMAQAVFIVGIIVVEAIVGLINDTLGAVVGVLLGLLLFPILVGMQAYIYGKLTSVLHGSIPGAEPAEPVVVY